MATLSALFSIVVIDLVLSGDNAVVIGLAAHRLPPNERRWAIILGAGAAVILRVTLTGLATLLLRVPALEIVAGLLLLGIAFSLLKVDSTEREPADHPASLRGAIWTILMADVIMSLDNVLGVAAASRGQIGLLVFGLLLSMSILMSAGALIAGLINRFWWLAYLGTAVIAWTGADMIREDDLIQPLWTDWPWLQWAWPAILVLLVTALAHHYHRRNRRPTTPAATPTAPATPAAAAGVGAERPAQAP